ncbi:hypothetical protein Purlil1_13271 [Purpureocillium lilacinum]|uniref:Uncharacterized protein n=1 Tax=Purpureocillium lilacinum TaxID=33203 RepID=A0ABR0BEI7_PURLI|nr:hypothetical protein Purlil1_13271 [Purpureocillium lilacinum]
MRGASDNFNQYIEKLGTVVNNARRSHGTSANKHLWDGFDATLEKIEIARTGDHGPYLIKEAEETLGKKGFDIKRQKLGINPISNPPTQWETVDWAATSQAAKAKGIPDVDKLIREFRYEWYKGPRANGDARKHYVGCKAVVDRLVGVTTEDKNLNDTFGSVTSSSSQAHQAIGP